MEQDQTIQTVEEAKAKVEEQDAVIGGVTVKRTDVKDEIALTGTNLEAVSQSGLFNILYKFCAFAFCDLFSFNFNL